jgi:clan AA aspartic protease (TIGR02281 family)
MSGVRCKICFWAWLGVSLAVSPLSAQLNVPTTNPAAVQSPEEVLKSKGLARVGPLYILEEDAKIQDRLRSLRQAKVHLDDTAHRRALLQLDITAAENSIAQWDAELLAINQRMADTTDAATREEMVSPHNILLSKMREASRMIASRQKVIASLPDSWEEYISALLSLSDQAEAIAHRYEVLAADAATVSALAAVNKQMLIGAAVKLGPSSALAGALPFIRKERQALDSATIKFKIEGGVPVVNVTLNGKATRTMVFDSGAAIVSLCWDTAQQAGLTPGNDDPVIKLTTASGAVVDARLMTLKSVRLGQFTVENVHCTVLPRAVIGPDLLGGTFLRNFGVRLDLAKQELHLSQLVGTQPDTSVASIPSETPKEVPDGGKTGDPKPDVPTEAPRPIRTDTVGGAGGGEFEQVASKGGILVGINCTVGNWAGHKVINSVTPVFAMGTEKSVGQIRGQSTSSSVSAIAKPGYAVGGIVARSGNRLDGFKIIFMRRKGNQLDPADSYDSDWMGGTGGGETRIGGDGKRVIGIFGRAGAEMDALGLVQQ